MPFPLAHPAAVLPFRRYCPHWLNFTALLVGSVSPDLGYLFGPLKVDVLSHTLAGSVLFCLPAGYALWWALSGPLWNCGLGRMLASRSWIVRRLFLEETVEGERLPRTSASPFSCPSATASEGERQGVSGPGLSSRAWSLPQRGEMLKAAFSIVLGAWTHLLWDGFTHKRGWFVVHIGVLRAPLGTCLGHEVRVFHLLWYACSFAGVAIVYFACERLRCAAQGAALREGTLAGALWKACGLGLIAVAAATVHHLVRTHLFSYLGGLLAVVLVLVIGLRTTEPRGCRRCL